MIRRPTHLRPALWLLVAALSALTAGEAAWGAVSGEAFQYSGYMRAGSGSNLRAANQACFNNPGAAANEFRLGNECSIYGELAFTAYHLGTAAANTPFVRTQLRLATSSPGYRSFEPQGPERDIQVVELFTEISGVDGQPWSYWAGKRFYRDVDLHIYDWYYFGETNGNGAGISHIPVGVGSLSLAQLFHTGDEIGASGRRQLWFTDVRLWDVPVTDNHRLYFWGGYGTTAGGSGEDDDGTPYTLEAADGWLLAVRHRYQAGNGFNDLSLGYGAGLMRGFSLWGQPARVGSDVDLGRAHTWRLVDHLTLTLAPRWAFHLGLAGEWRETGALVDGREEWLSLALRPVYYITDHLHLAFEVGSSRVTRTADRDGDGNAVGARWLSRITIAPQLSIARDIWGRPVIRAFFSHSFWNDANRGYVGDASYGDETAGSRIGFQTEIWF